MSAAPPVATHRPSLRSPSPPFSQILPSHSTNLLDWTSNYPPKLRTLAGRSRVRAHRRLSAVLVRWRHWVDSLAGFSARAQILESPPETSMLPPLRSSIRWSLRFLLFPIPS
ncbi:UNVERIFIED_CONTAM: hypothetical protein Sradi_0312700 [Sesamum radiatum]|uniref:Uncharacterized protein n=1 Tax=Sesamum radiatum TaxID=300843 RepID=A0AAW2W357_SESRA